MSDVSIQMRRVTDKVEQFFRLFGFSTSTFSSATRTQVKARKRLGTEDIECVIAETSRGTSVGFYSVNVFQGLVYIIPFLFLVLMHLFALSDTIRPFLDGTRENSKLSINWLVLVTGEATLSFKFVTFILLIGILPFLTDYYIQKIRLNNLKSRFSFYSKEAMWETSEIPYSIATLQASRSIISHTWFLTVFYFGVFAFQGETQLEIYKIFQTSSENLKSAITDVFTFTIGFILGLISAEKSLLLRKDLSKFDARSRFSGSIFERRFDSILFGVQSSLITSSLFLLFLSVTFLPSATFVQASQFLLMAIIGGVVAGLIYQEGPSWVYTSYAIAIIFSTILFIFKTGTQSGYAFIINVQLFFIPIPFILLGSRYYSEYLKKYNIENHEWLYDVFPLMSLLSVYQSTKRRKEVKIAYEKTLTEVISDELLPNKIIISKEAFQDVNSIPHKLAKHYFELVLSYTASFDETAFVIIPNHNQLLRWWSDKSKQISGEKNIEFIKTVDKLLWDPDYIPAVSDLLTYEVTGKEMVLSIK